MVAAVVALGVKFLGTLLTGAIIFPAVSARNLAKNMNSFQILSILFGIVSILAKNLSFSSGPNSFNHIGIFLISYVFKGK